MAKQLVYVTGTYPRASETFIQQEMELLLESDGFVLTPVSVFKGDGVATIDGMTYLSDRLPQPPAEGSAAVARLKSLLSGPLRRFLSITKHKAQLNALSDLVERTGADHIHAAFGGFPAMLCSAVANAHTISYSVSVHANDILCSPYDDRSMLEDADRIFCCNHRTIDELAKRSPWTAEKTTYLPHGLRLADWPFRDVPGTLHVPLQCLFVGRLTEKKDPFRAKALVEALNQAGIEADITFVGDGALKDDTMRVTGFKSRSEVRQLMVESDILLSTSRELEDGDMEGIPNVILEAMATGLPVVAPLTGGIGEVVSEETGYPFDPQDTEAFITLIKEIVNNPKDRADRCARAQNMVRARFSAETAIAEKITYFSSC